jgi:NAD(P)-dependent dehydrogenase (short-subunit alcohol dehydrogenase family)
MVTQIGQRFKNKVVLVTGAAHGIGQAIALRFGSEGGQVIVNDVNFQGTEDTVQAIITNGGLAIPGIADVSDKSQVDHLFDTVLEHFGTVDVLVNNAGLINVERHFLEADEAWWDRVLAVNLKSVFLCSLRAAQVIKASLLTCRVEEPLAPTEGWLRMTHRRAV